MSISAIAQAIGKLFGFLKAERDPDKQRLRRSNYEYRVLKEAVRVAAEIHRYEELLKKTTETKKKMVYEHRILILWEKFIRLLAIE